ncbi:N-acyl homoserine lactonase family protein [Peristeroidobacter agariperforans]|uniref:N-acyl homoserine lactonase family protein n=1 Tax=Peristeroidobacter agariperforans TaxID=268404 RepID=UPI00101DEA92|nr:N-acyl homoserine lactonase family protein [Peristeroidobacter agariperforans]
MNPRSLTLLAIAVFLVATGTPAASPAPVKLWRLDCGAIQEDDLNLFSDTYAYLGKSKQLTAACYLIKHGETYMLWDTGLSIEALGKPLQGAGATGESLSKSLPDQLQTLGVDPKQIAIIGISHYHYDHTGQAALFPQARLLMGKGDIDALRTPGSARAKPLTHWLNGAGKLEEVTGDKDVFGDRSVVMLDLPGHTPGHHGLLVKLAKQGYVLLSGDVAHFEENYATNGVPIFNSDRAQSLASLDRFKNLAKNLRATVVIQHEQADIGKLPAFPAGAE